MTEKINENQTVIFQKIRKITLIILLITGVVLIPLLILAFLDIGGMPIFILSTIILGLLILESLLIIIPDMIRIFKLKRKKL
ncbi:MAG: hypothetical protein ACFFDW_05605 [Candidatus Thorarchaeota archaeon]